MSKDCLFCKIVGGEVPAEKIYEDEKVVGFKDINPVAKIHLLFVHRNHSKDINQMVSQSPNDFIDIYNAIRAYTVKEGLDQNGFRVVTNLGKNVGQAIFHTHFHLFAGERLSWP